MRQRRNTSNFEYVFRNERSRRLLGEYSEQDSMHYQGRIATLVSEAGEQCTGEIGELFTRQRWTEMIAHPRMPRDATILRQASPLADDRPSA